VRLEIHSLNELDSPALQCRPATTAAELHALLPAILHAYASKKSYSGRNWKKNYEYILGTFPHVDTT